MTAQTMITTIEELLAIDDDIFIPMWDNIKD